MSEMNVPLLSRDVAPHRRTETAPQAKRFCTKIFDRRDVFRLPSGISVEGPRFRRHAAAAEPLGRTESAETRDSEEPRMPNSAAPRAAVPQEDRRPGARNGKPANATPVHWE